MFIRLITYFAACEFYDKLSLRCRYVQSDLNKNVTRANGWGGGGGGREGSEKNNFQGKSSERKDMYFGVKHSWTKRQKPEVDLGFEGRSETSDHGDDIREVSCIH